MINDPIVFSYLNAEGNTDVITLLINPENLTILEKDRISQVMTKSRLVTLFWGKQPINFTYAGQTGSLIPTVEEFNAYLASSKTETNSIISALNVENSGLEDLKAIKQTALANTSITSATRVALERELVDIDLTLDANKRNIQILRSEDSDKSKVLLSYTDLAKLEKKSIEVLNMSAKWKLFKRLEKFYRESKDNGRLVQVQFRDRTYKGYFTDFSFTDDARNPWNWKYSLSITVLSWDDAYAN